MADLEKIYTYLFNEVTEAIVVLEEGRRNAHTVFDLMNSMVDAVFILQQVQRDTLRMEKEMGSK